jgi:hypothetical protein
MLAVKLEKVANSSYCVLLIMIDRAGFYKDTRVELIFGQWEEQRGKGYKYVRYAFEAESIAKYRLVPNKLTSAILLGDS